MKKSSLHTFALAAVVAASLGAVSIANAQDHMANGAQNHMNGASAQGHMMNGMQTLTPQQQETAQKLNAEFVTATTGLRQEIINKSNELNAQVNGEAPDATKIEALSKEIGVLQGKLLAEQAILNTKLAKAGVPTMGHGMMNGGIMNGGAMGHGAMGHGMMNGSAMGQGAMGMNGQGCMKMGNMGAMMNGAHGGHNGHNQPAGGQPNQSGHRM